MLLAPQPFVLSFSLYFAAGAAFFGNAGIDSVRELAPAIENAGVNSVQALAPIVQQLEIAGVNSVRAFAPIVQHLDTLVRRVAYLLLTTTFLIFVLVVLARYARKATGLKSLGSVLGAGFLAFLFALWCVSWEIQKADVYVN